MAVHFVSVQAHEIDAFSTSFAPRRATNPIERPLKAKNHGASR